MNYKKIPFLILEKIEKKNAEKKMIDMKNVSLNNKQCYQQLELLINYQNEYIKKLFNKTLVGILSYEWNNYKDFIYLLNCIIQDHKTQIKKNEKKMKKKINNYLKNQSKLKVWSLLNFKNKQVILKHKELMDQKLNNELSQLNAFQKGLLS
ncbi:flagellar export protein FliJ [Buchnera aphidicola (Muscaphis stroyani)]|uniref:Flagellar FliJ protein n=1 Tax=Buchnera aphidicola (Muscaphis stroyani) TaxID=1241869 RepID=A0A4D6YED4_9GAMM|nr:flagellar FliJ family protein [Buchnera aphidicola]QCI24184.1 flagellar export protein FliJ [Buchnera aphidicola (Muscaphis stroyani)]